MSVSYTHLISAMNKVNAVMVGGLFDENGISAFEMCIRDRNRAVSAKKPLFREQWLFSFVFRY